MFFKYLKLYLVFTFLSVSTVFINSACVSNDLELAKNEVEKIRNLVKTSQFERIFNESHSKFQSSVSKENFIQDLRDVSNDIRNSQNFSLFNWRVDNNTSQSFITLTYMSNGKTKFLDSEEFTFVWENGKYRLYNYSAMNKE